MHVIKMFHTKKSDQEINSMPNEALVIKSEAMLKKKKVAGEAVAIRTLRLNMLTATKYWKMPPSHQ